MSENKGKAKVKSKSKSIAKNAGKNKAAVMNSRNPKKPMAISGDTMSNYAMYKKGGKVKKYATGGMKKYQTAGQAYMQYVPGAVASDTLGVGDPANKFGMPSKKTAAQQKMLDLTYGKGRQQNSNEEDSGNAIYNRVSQAAGDVGNYVTDLKNRVTSGNWFNKKGGATKSKYKSGGMVKKKQSGGIIGYKGQPSDGSTKTAGSWRLEKKLAKEKQKKEIYEVQGYTDKRDKSDAQARRAAEITGGNKTKNKNNTTISNDNVNSSSSSSRNTNANQNANQNSSSSSSSSNARGGSGGSSTVRATGGDDLSTNAYKSSNVAGGAQNSTDQNMNSNNKKQKGGLIKSKNKIMRTKTKKMQVGGINSNNRKSTSNRTNVTIDRSDRSDKSDRSVNSQSSNNVSGGTGNYAEQNVRSKNNSSRNTTNQSQRSTNVSNRSNRSTTNTNRSNVGNASSRTNQTVVRKKGGMVKKQNGGAAVKDTTGMTFPYISPKGAIYSTGKDYMSGTPSSPTDPRNRDYISKQDSTAQSKTGYTALTKGEKKKGGMVKSKKK